MRNYLTFTEIGEAVADYYIGSHDKAYSFGEFILNVYLTSLQWPELRAEKNNTRATQMLFELSDQYV
jgi:hypothetical protein